MGWAGVFKIGGILVLVLTSIVSVVSTINWIGDARENKILAKQLAEANTRLVATVREKNEQNAKFLALPDVRNRLCAVKGPQDGCCTETAECKP